MEEQEARKMSQYELELKLDRMTQRAFPNSVQKAPRKPLSEVDIEIIKEYQQQFNEPIKEQQYDIDPETGESVLRLKPDGTPDYKVKTKKFRVVPPPELEVVNDRQFYIIPTDKEKEQAYNEFEAIKKFIETVNEELRILATRKKQILTLIDELPRVQTFFSEELPSGKFALRPNPNAEEERRDIQDQKDYLLGRLEQMDRQIAQITEESKEAADIYNSLNSEYQKIESYKSFNDAEVARVKKINSARIKEYQSTLNLMNRGAFVQEQMPNESEEDYLDRLQANAEEEYIGEAAFEAELDIKRRFKEALKKLIRNDVIIEQVANRITDDEKEIKTEILKKFPLFRKKFIEIYGLNNSVVSAPDIITFIEAFFKSIRGDSALINLIQEQKPEQIELGEENRTALQLAEQDKGKVYVVESPTGNKKKVYFRLAESLADNALYLLYSFSGERGSYREFIPSDEDLTPQDEEKNRPNSFVEIRKQTGITGAYLRTQFNNKPYKSVVKQSKSPLKFNASTGFNWIDWLSKRINTTTDLDEIPAKYENPYEFGGKDYPATMGWGIRSEEVPDMVDFGKIKLALNKLFYQNILSARHNNLGRIAGFPNVKVSDDFVAIVMKLVKGEKLIKQEIDALTKSEQILYDKLLSLANLHKKSPNNKDSTILALKERLDLIGGSIDAGNDNRDLVKEAYNIVHALKRFGVITNKEATKYLSQF